MNTMFKDYYEHLIYFIDKLILIMSQDLVSELKLQFHQCVHFWTNTLGKGMNALILPVMD